MKIYLTKAGGNKMIDRKRTNKSRNNRINPGNPLEVEGNPLEVEIAQTILKGGSFISASGEVISHYNCPRSYSEAQRRGYNFYIYEES